MRVYDVEVLNVTIEDAQIAKLLTQTQHAYIQQRLELATEQRNLDVRQQQETIKQQIAQAEAHTQRILVQLQMEDVTKRRSLHVTEIEAAAEEEKLRLDNQLAQQQAFDTIHGAELERQRATQQYELSVTEQQLHQRLAELNAQVSAVVQKAQAVSPDLIAALQAFADKALAERVAESMAPLAILGGKSIADVFGQLVQGTMLEQTLTQTAKKK